MSVHEFALKGGQGVLQFASELQVLDGTSTLYFILFDYLKGLGSFYWFVVAVDILQAKAQVGIILIG